jgi:hypothetical protein
VDCFAFSFKTESDFSDLTDMAYEVFKEMLSEFRRKPARHREPPHGERRDVRADHRGHPQAHHPQEDGLPVMVWP